MKKVFGLIKKILYNPTFLEMIRFGINGAVCFIVDYGLLYLLTEFCGVHYLISSSIGFVASVILNYIICIIWVFKTDTKKTIKTKVAFFLTSVIGALINLFIMWLLVDIFTIYYLLAKIFSIIVVMIWNYFTKKSVLTKKSDKVEV